MFSVLNMVILTTACSLSDGTTVSVDQGICHRCECVPDVQGGRLVCTNIPCDNTQDTCVGQKRCSDGTCIPPSADCPCDTEGGRYRICPDKRCVRTTIDCAGATEPCESPTSRVCPDGACVEGAASCVGEHAHGIAMLFAVVGFIVLLLVVFIALSLTGKHVNYRTPIGCNLAQEKAPQPFSKYGGSPKFFPPSPVHQAKCHELAYPTFSLPQQQPAVSLPTIPTVSSIYRKKQSFKMKTRR